MIDPVIEYVTAENVEGYRRLRLEALCVAPEVYVDTIEPAFDKDMTGWEREASASKRRIIIAANPVSEEPIGMQSVDVSSDVATLHGLYVKPASRGNGVGRLLISAGLDFAREAGAANARTSVLHGNEGAIRLLESVGFVLDAAVVVDRARNGKIFGEYRLSATLGDVE